MKLFRVYVRNDGNNEEDNKYEEDCFFHTKITSAGDRDDIFPGRTFLRTRLSPDPSEMDELIL